MPKKISPEVKARAVRMVQEHQEDYLLTSRPRHQRHGQVHLGSVSPVLPARKTSRHVQRWASPHGADAHTGLLGVGVLRALGTDIPPYVA